MSIPSESSASAPRMSRTDDEAIWVRGRIGRPTVELLRLGRVGFSIVSDRNRITISYPSDLSRWGRYQIEKSSFRSYLKKTLGRVREGQNLDEFVDVGCCGNTLDVPLRVESIEGSPGVTEETVIEFVEGEAAGVRGGWRVQSAGGPSRPDW